MNRIAFALPLSLALAACGSADEPPTDLNSAESDGAAAALARNIEAGEFLDLELGAKIVGPQGEEVTSALSNAEGNFADMRSFVEELRAVPRAGELPPIIFATLRKKMIQLSETIANGMVFANGARSHMKSSLAVLSDQSRSENHFFIGNMIPTCVHDDVEAAKAVNRRTLTSYAMLPNYRNYWKEAGYEEEMDAVEAAVNDRDFERVASCLSDRWLADTTLFGTATDVRDGLAAWFDAGIKTPIVVPSAVEGGQFKAFEEFFELWD